MVAEILVDRIAAGRHAVAVIAVLDVDHAAHAQPVEDMRIGRGAPAQRKADRPRRLRRAVGGDAFLAVAPVAKRDVERVRLADRIERARTHRILGGIFARAVRSEEHTSELQSLMRISYAVFCLKKKKKRNKNK